MPDLFEPADSSSRSGEVGIRDRLIVSGKEGLPAPSLQLPERPEQTTALPLLLFEHVSKWYGPVIGVNQVTLELRPGITGLVGANGAGKSTLMRLATGQLRPDLGRVLVVGRPAWEAQAKRHVGYCPDVDRFYEEMSGRQF